MGVFHAFNLLSNEVDFDDSIDEFACANMVEHRVEEFRWRAGVTFGTTTTNPAWNASFLYSVRKSNRLLVTNV